MLYFFKSRGVFKLSLKELVYKYTKQMMLILIAFLTLCVGFFNIIMARQEANSTAQTTFYHIEQILNENQKDLNEQKKEYRQTCIDNAKAVAYSLQENQNALNDVNELRKIAQYIEVDEIHIFNKQGVIVSGTHPEYYGYSFDSGKQMSFFKPLLTNQNLQLTQKTMENTAAHKKIQYSALWSENKEFIVQIGMTHENASKVIKKNQLSYLFKLFRVNSEANYYAINQKTHQIVGSTHQKIGEKASSIGLKDKQIKASQSGFFTTIEGKISYCVSKKIGKNYVYRIIPMNVLFKDVPSYCIEMLICFIVISILYRLLIIKYMDHYVIKSIEKINIQLSKITNGYLEEKVEVDNSLEFQELSHYINEMKHSILVNSKKMEYILTKTNQSIGFYEYNQKLNSFYVSDVTQEIFSLSQEQYFQFKNNLNNFKAFLEEIYKNKVENEEDIYYLSKSKRYIKLNEQTDEDDIFGVIIDVTTSFIKRKMVENERDIDSLTQLYNRSGLEKRINGLLKQGHLEYSALMFIDSDGLKQINDIYGHHYGDLYLNEIANILKKCSQGQSVVGRLGGDEFIIFFYHYESLESLQKAIQYLKERQNQPIDLTDDCHVNIAFSCGVCYLEKNLDFSKMLEIADQKMYQDKRIRKGR